MAPWPGKEALDSDLAGLALESGCRPKAKRSRAAPAVNAKVGVQGQNVRGLQLIGEVDQASVRELHGYAFVAVHERIDGFHDSVAERKPAGRHVGQQILARAP